MKLRLEMADFAFVFVTQRLRQMLAEMVCQYYGIKYVDGIIIIDVSVCVPVWFAWCGSKSCSQENAIIDVNHTVVVNVTWNSWHR